jgi:hypothetical protein
MDIKTIINICGGYSAIAQAVTEELKKNKSIPVKERKITRQAVFQWKKVPIKHLRTVKKLSKLTFKQLRPDIWGE